MQADLACHGGILAVLRFNDGAGFAAVHLVAMGVGRTDQEKTCAYEHQDLDSFHTGECPFHGGLTRSMLAVTQPSLSSLIKN